jgi:hypothetical protein
VLPSIPWEAAFKQYRVPVKSLSLYNAKLQLIKKLIKNRKRRIVKVHETSTAALEECLRTQHLDESKLDELIAATLFEDKPSLFNLPREKLKPENPPIFHSQMAAAIKDGACVQEAARKCFPDWKDIYGRPKALADRYYHESTKLESLNGERNDSLSERMSALFESYRGNAAAKRWLHKFWFCQNIESRATRFGHAHILSYISDRIDWMFVEAAHSFGANFVFNIVDLSVTEFTDRCSGPFFDRLRKNPEYARRLAIEASLKASKGMTLEETLTRAVVNKFREVGYMAQHGNRKK